MEEYNKILTIYERDTKTKKLIEGNFINPSVEYLKDNIWNFTEKIDGTNIRILWDGHKVTFGGRTDNAQIPASLISKLNDLFGGEKNAQLFEQKFGDMEVMLCGEGYGKGIQNGGLYKESQDFILFDVKISENWQSRENVLDIANYFNIQTVPTVFNGTIQQAVNWVKTKPKSLIGDAPAEGLVGRPMLELQDRTGKRLIIKIKVQDFE